MDQGIYIEESCQTFCDFMNEWLPIYSEAKDVKLDTIRVRLYEIGKLLLYFRQLKLKVIAPKRYQDGLYDLKDREYSDIMREGNHRTGRVIFQKALEFELIKKDPTEFAYLKKDKKTIEQLEEEELQSIWKNKNFRCF